MKLGAQLRGLISIVSYDTFRRWIRGAETKQINHDQPQQRTGRPRTASDIRELVLRIARENSWGYTVFWASFPSSVHAHLVADRESDPEGTRHCSSPRSWSRDMDRVHPHSCRHALAVRLTLQTDLDAEGVGESLRVGLSPHRHTSIVALTCQSPSIHSLGQPTSGGLPLSCSIGQPPADDHAAGQRCKEPDRV